MPVTLTINGVPFQYPERGDKAWGPAATAWATAVTNLCAQFAASTEPIADDGQIRLGNTDTIQWRNFADDGNAAIYVDVDDKLYFDDGVNPPIDLSSVANGNVTGPLSSTDKAIVRFNGALGQTVQNSTAILTDAGALSGLTTLAMAGNLSGVVDIAMSGNLATPVNITASGLVTTADLTVTDNADLVDLDVSGLSTLNTVTADLSDLISNIGITYAAGTFTVTDSLGAALSGANPGFIALPSTTAGQSIVLTVTSGGTFNDDAHASSDLTNFGFGITQASDWAEDMPFFLYAVNRANSNIDGADGSSAFFISRAPNLIQSPNAVGNIGDTTTLPADDTQKAVIILDAVTSANYTNLPCRVIGSFRMRWATGTDDWTVQALSNAFGDGIGNVQLAKKFAAYWTMPLAQNGATTGSFLLANGGTAPTFSTNTYKYQIQPDGKIQVFIRLFGDGGTDGAGAVTTFVVAPAAVSVDAGTATSAYFVQMDSTVTGTQFVSAQFGASSTVFDLNEGTGATVVQHGDFTNGARYILASFLYSAFDPTV